MDGADRPRRVLGVLLGALVIAAALGVFAVTLRGGGRVGDGDAAEVLAISTGSPVHETLDQLVTASDHIVEAEVVAVDAGRTLTDPSDPRAGVVTRLVQLEIRAAYVGAPVPALVVEEGRMLLDGTPIVVDGVEPSAVGDVGFFFLVDGDGEAFPYTALVNEQGRYLLVDGGLVAANRRTALADALATSTADQLRAALRDAALTTR